MYINKILHIIYEIKYNIIYYIILLNIKVQFTIIIYIKIKIIYVCAYYLIPIKIRQCRMCNKASVEINIHMNVNYIWMKINLRIWTSFFINTYYPIPVYNRSSKITL
jgi:hypothetical protein